MFTCVLGRYVASTVLLVPKPFGSADRVGGQLRGDKGVCPFSGVTRSGRVWRKVPESDARSMISTQAFRKALITSVDRCAEIKKSAPSVA